MRRHSSDLYIAATTQDPLSLGRTDGSHLYLHANQTFHHIPHPDYKGEWKVTTDSYIYTLSLTEGFEQEILSFQWHPDSDSKIKTPHVHASLVGPRGLQKIHIPTRRILLEDVLWLAIDDFDVQPLLEDWKDVLGDAIKRVEEFGSWMATPKKRSKRQPKA